MESLPKRLRLGGDSASPYARSPWGSVSLLAGAKPLPELARNVQAAAEAQPAQLKELDAWVAGHEAGSKAAERAAAGAKEARKALAWLEERHPEWLAAASGASGIANVAIREDRAAVDLAALTAAYIGDARRSAARYDSFVGAHVGDLTPAGRRTPTPDIVAWFLRHEQAASYLKKGDDCKGTTGDALAKGLAKAHAAFGAPFPPEVAR